MAEWRSKVSGDSGSQGGGEGDLGSFTLELRYYQDKVRFTKSG
jgi:hypothetical protein